MDDAKTVTRALLDVPFRAARGEDPQMLQDEMLQLLAAHNKLYSERLGQKTSALTRSLVGSLLHLIAENPTALAWLQAGLSTMFGHIAASLGLPASHATVTEEEVREYLSMAHEDLTPHCPSPLW